MFDGTTMYDAAPPVHATANLGCMMDLPPI